MDLFYKRIKLINKKVKMSYGKYSPTEVVFAECWGREVLVTVPDRYSGQLRAKFYDANDNHIEYPQTYFEQMAIMSGQYFSTYTKQVAILIEDYCTDIRNLLCTSEFYHICKGGFGEEYENGLIDFTTEKPIEASDLNFKINNESYVIKWDYLPRDPYSDEGETYEYE